jgi:hypothetical protein
MQHIQPSQLLKLRFEELQAYLDSYLIHLRSNQISPNESIYWSQVLELESDLLLKLHKERFDYIGIICMKFHEIDQAIKKS